MTRRVGAGVFSAAHIASKLGATSQYDQSRAAYCYGFLSMCFCSVSDRPSLFQLQLEGLANHSITA